MHPELKDLYMSNHIQALAEANHRAAQTMESIGGGFAAALALAYFRADGGNQARILAAFPDLFEKYRRMSQELRELAD
jgi:monomeric isocitrate dehydrogenase